MPSALVFGCACLLDRLVGDPPGWYHPVQAMGTVIGAVERLALPRIKSATGRRWLGAILTVGLAGGVALGSWGLMTLGTQVHPWLGIAVEVVLMAACFAGRSLGDAARAVLVPLAAGDLATAREVLSRYVGRDTEDLSEEEMQRAILETVAENTTDGVTAPIFYAVLGGAPLALAFKAVSTLDSMIGYKTEPYTHFGWFAARTDDWLNWIPARLTALTIALLSGHPARVLRTVRRDGPLDPSPNSGVSMAAFAGAIGVRLGGANCYRGIIKIKPFLGRARKPMSADAVRRSLALLEWTGLSWTVVGLLWLGLLESWISCCL